ncbi:serine hydrolase [Streptomyces sp. NPDC058583]|uniref:serine hydrolase n=1 Tax=unclassified Streptomyces TaxID=2593676 RepID=UPI003648EFE9
MQQVHTRQDPRLPGLGYGYGYEQWQRSGHTGWFKDGDIPGFHSNLLLLPAHGLGIFVVFNGDGTDGRAAWDGRNLIDEVLGHLLPDSSTTPDGPRPTADHALATYTCSYRAARVSRTSLMALEGLAAAVTVEADGETGLRTTGLSLDPAQGEQRWTALGDGLFREHGGSGATIAFTGQGLLVSSATPSTAYEKLTWRQPPALHLTLLASGLAVLALGVIAYPATAALRHLRGRTPHPRAARAARATAALAGLLAVAFAASLTAVVSDANAMMERVPLGSPPCCPRSPPWARPWWRRPSAWWPER